MGQRSYNRIVADAAIKSQGNANITALRSQCGVGQASVFNTNPDNLDRYFAADMTCTSAQRESAAQPNGNEQYYAQLAASLKKSSAMETLALLVSRAADNKGRCETAAEAGFTLGYQPAAPLTSGVNKATVDQLFTLARSLNAQQVQTITTECYTPETDNFHEIGGLKLTKTQAGLIAGIRNGQQAKEDHLKLRPSTQADTPSLPSVFSPASAAEAPRR